MDRVTSGSRRLDSILGGGLVANAINLLTGAPGSGKTILAQQYVFANATPDAPAVYFSTVSEPFDKILRYGQELDFFDADRIGSAVFYEDLGSILQEDGLQGALDRVAHVVHQRRPRLIVIDSFKALAVFATDEGEYRRFLHDLAGHLSALAVTSFWLCEFTHGEVLNAPEFAVADSIVSLGVRQALTRSNRFLQVLKLRGSGYGEGEHGFRITPGGLDVFPRLADVDDSDGLGPRSQDRTSTGVPALDSLIGHGYWPGTATLIAGPSGVGKTLLGLHFVYAGAQVGEPGVFATLQENASMLQRVADGFRWDLSRDGVTVLNRTPVALGLDQFVYEVLETVERVGARRLVVDSLNDLEIAAADDIRFREWMYSLIQRCAMRGVSLMMTLEVPELFNMTRLSATGMSHLADNVVLLQYEREGSRLGRSVTVLKTRASAHTPGSTPYHITASGFMLGDPEPAPA